MIKSKTLTTNYCKNCKYFKYEKLSKDTILYSCKKSNEVFSIDEPKLESERKCFKRKLLKRGDKDG